MVKHYHQIPVLFPKPFRMKSAISQPLWQQNSQCTHWKEISAFKCMIYAHQPNNDDMTYK